MRLSLYFLASLTPILAKLEAVERNVSGRSKTVSTLFAHVKFKNFIILDLSDEEDLFKDNINVLMGLESAPNALYIFRSNFMLLTRVKLVAVTHVDVLDNLHDLQMFLSGQHGDYVYNKYVKYVFFVLSFRRGDERYLPKIMDMIWKRNMWNYHLVYFDDYELINFVYNPFSKDIVVNSNRSDQMSKFDDLLGYRINVTMHFFTNDEDLLVLRSLEQIMNASFHVKMTWSFHEIYTDIKDGRSDFSLVGQFYGTFPGVKYSEPFKPDHIVIVVARAPILPQFLKLLLIFEPAMWFNLILTVALSMLLVYIVQRTKLSMIMLDLFRVLIGQSGFFRVDFYKFGVRLFLMSLSFFSLIVSNVYTSSLLSAILSAKYYPEINTLAQLHATNQTICTLTEYADLIPASFRNRTRLMEAIDFGKEFMENNGSCAFAIMRSLAEKVIASYVRSFGRNDFHIVQESFVPGYEAFIFNKRSPFIYKVNSILKAIEQSGLNRYKSVSKEARSVEFQEYTTLKLHHFATPFGILTIGLIHSSIIFALELLIHKLFPKF